MDEKFYLDDFELSLKEQANQFKMVPSKRVWHGIYNDLHPGRRWPSIMMSLLLISSIVYVGYINSHIDNKVDIVKANVALNNKTKNIYSSQELETKRGKAIIRHDDLKNRNSIRLSDNKRITNPTIASELKTNSSLLNKTVSIKENNRVSKLLAINNSNGFRISQGDTKEESIDILNPNVSHKTNTFKEISKALNTRIISKNDPIALSLEESEDLIDLNNSAKSENVKVISTEQKTTITNKLINAKNIDHTNKENISKENNSVVKKSKKKNEKISWNYFAGFAASNASLKGEHLKASSNSNLTNALPQVIQKDAKVLRSAALGYEAGIQMNYSFAKKLQITTGLHITHSGYNIISNEVHPTFATLLLRNSSTGNMYSRNFITHNGDGTGQVTTTLRNYNLQASLPLGLQYVLWENTKFKINIASDIESSINLKTDAYLLSSDGRNYVNVPDLLRKWNFGSDFGAFVTFKSQKFNWNIGPNVRYQWLSSYQEDYTVKEHLINYGIRVGITK